MAREHIVVNTIGLTAAELMLAEVARFPEVLTLPGQNFIQVRKVLYRPHSYDGVPVDEVFDSLNLHQIMKSGRCWAGLTKSMSAAEAAAYSADRHFEFFRQRLGDKRDFLACVEAYAESFYECYGADPRPARFIAHFGHNLTLQQNTYPGFSERTWVINFSNRPFRWLASISQRMTWNPIGALKFFIVHGLLLRRYAASNSRFLNVDLDELAADRAATVARVRSFLRLPALPEGDGVPRVPGFMSMNQELLRQVGAEAKMIEAIYHQHPIAVLASTMDDWAADCLVRPEVGVVLDDYLEYWNSTAHTNFDWAGPMEEAVLAVAPRPPMVALPTSCNLSATFYQDQIDLCSDNFNTPVVRLRHGLGALDKRIVLPPLPFFIRAAIAYLTEVCRGHLQFAHSYVPVREGDLYRRLQEKACQARIDQTGIRDKADELETLIDQVEAEVGKVTARSLRGPR